jgi:hypothetical protein
VKVQHRSISGAIQNRNGLPRPDWDVIFAWVEQNVAEDDLDDTWCNIALSWLNELSGPLPKGYESSASDNFFVLGKGTPAERDRYLRWCEFALCKVQQILPDVTSDEGYGKHLLIAFEEEDAYYDYISDYYPEEGKFGLSLGMFIDSGYGHIVICRAPLTEQERVIAHEITHNLIRHLPLPVWLNEGLTQVIEDMVMGSSYFVLAPEIGRDSRRYWNAETIQTFWSGESFADLDSQELSYALARILFSNLLRDYPKQTIPFLQAANYSDAGNAAVMEYCGTTLSDLAAQFLGPGDWQPNRDFSNPEQNNRD